MRCEKKDYNRVILGNLNSHVCCPCHSLFALIVFKNLESLDFTQFVNEATHFKGRTLFTSHVELIDISLSDYKAVVCNTALHPSTLKPSAPIKCFKL